MSFVARVSESCRALSVASCLAVCALATGAVTAGEVCESTLGPVWVGGRADFHVNPAFPDHELSGPPSLQVELLRCAAGAWRDQSRADFAFVYQGTTSARGFDAGDGVNSIAWVNADGGRALAATILAGEGDKAVAFDVVFFATTEGVENRWNGPGEPASGTLDITGIAVHELGHALGLDHSAVAGATMFASARNRGLPLRTLHEDDRNCVEFLYGLRTPEPPAVEIVSVTPNTGPPTGRNEVVLGGVNFTYESETRLTVNGMIVPSSRWTVETCERLRIHDMPAQGEGSAAIALVNSIGSTSLADAYLYAGDPIRFRRGDCNGNGLVSGKVGDAVFLLRFLFVGGAVPPCMAACDIDGDGRVSGNVADALFLLTYNFRSGRPPPSPFPDCGVIGESDLILGCMTPPPDCE